MGCAGDQIHEPTASPGAGEREVGLAVSRGKLDRESACGTRAHLAIDHEPTRGLKGYHRRVGARAEVAVDCPGREPLLFQRPLDLAHPGPGHAWLGEPIDDDLGFPHLLARIPLGVLDLGDEDAHVPPPARDRRRGTPSARTWAPAYPGRS